MRHLTRPSAWVLAALLAVLVVLESYAATGDPRTIVIHYTIGAGDKVVGPRVVEDDRSVTVEVKTSVWFPGRGTFKNLSATFMQVPITLKNPLGDRAVLDRNTGKRIPRSPAS